MIDTVRLVSPFISEYLASWIEKSCVLRQGIDLGNGEVRYSFTSGSLTGSYDHRISVQVKRDMWVSRQISCDKFVPVKVNCNPYIIVEGSIHKALLGHNVYGGPKSFQQSVKWFINLLSDLLKVSPLPDYSDWYVYRVDYAEVYNLGSFDAVREYFRGLNGADYPRRSVSRFGFHGLYVSGNSTTLKFYHKGPEFCKHDRSRLKRYWNDKKLNAIIDIANKILRVEVEIKKRRLEYDFGCVPLVSSVDDEYLQMVYDREVSKLLKEGSSGYKLVRSAHNVERRLYQVYSQKMAESLLGTWYRLSVHGEDYVKQTMKKTKFYDHRKKLKDAGISWTSTDVQLKNISLVPSDFSPVRSDVRRLDYELPRVTFQLMKVV